MATQTIDKTILYALVIALLFLTIKETATFLISSDSYVKTNFMISEKMIEDDPLMNKIINQCSSFQDPAQCIINTYVRNFKIEFHHDPFIRSATEINESGMVCRDFSVNICTALRKLNYSCEYFLTPDHVLPIINRTTNFMYCRQVSAHEMYCD